MEGRPGEHRIHPGWWTLILFVLVCVFVYVTASLFAGSFRSSVPVTLTSDRSGLVMETNAKVKMRGVQVGRVAAINPGKNNVSLKLEIDPDQIRYIPANVQAQIQATTAFGAKFVDLIYPKNPSPARLAAGAVLHSMNVSTEVNTVFENLVDLLKMIDPAKLNAVLSAVADSVRGQGERIGEATTDLNQVLLAVNPRTDTIRQDWRAFKNFNDTYSAAAQNILTVLNAGSTTSTTVTNNATQLDNLLVNIAGFGNAGTSLLATSKDKLIAAINTLEPTINLLDKYSPEYACLFQGATWSLNNNGYYTFGAGNGYSLILDVGLLFGKDQYMFPDNLPVVAAKGGPGGKPGCGSLPDASKNFPVRYLVTNTGWGTGTDMRPNPGIGYPCFVNFFPVTAGRPLPADSRTCTPGPAVGLQPYPGAPAYGAPLYGPGGVPLWPGVPPGPPGPGPAFPNTTGEVVPKP